MAGESDAVTLPFDGVNIFETGFVTISIEFHGGKENKREKKGKQKNVIKSESICGRLEEEKNLHSVNSNDKSASAFYRACMHQWMDVSIRFDLIRFDSSGAGSNRQFRLRLFFSRVASDCVIICMSMPENAHLPSALSIIAGTPV